ncbi:MAG: peptidoglycan DD-metalloendopeptidase family protein [Candidatus Methylomirabilales bacterium]
MGQWPPARGKTGLAKDAGPSAKRVPLVTPPLLLAVLFFAAAYLSSQLLPNDDPATTEVGTSHPQPAPLQEVAPAGGGPSGKAIRGAIRRGQTFSQALARAGIPQTEAAQAVKALRPHIDFRLVQPGQQFEALLSEDGQRLLRLTYEVSPIDLYEVERTGEGLRALKGEVPLDTRTVVVQGTVRSSLFESLAALGETPQLGVNFVNLFVWDFDFNSQARPGDRFQSLVEKTYTGDRFVGYGRILAARYESRGKTYTAVYFETTPGRGDYYAADGTSVRKTFLRSPLAHRRISSRYSHRRRHPILGGVRPHLAIDYAAPSGTPVRSVAEGVIESAGWKGGHGKSVLIRHRRGYKTMYNHLSRIARGIRPGVQVRQKQVIGSVGSTGLATGPHLDYRVMKNGRFVNPLSQRFIPGDPVPKRHLKRFRATRDRLLGALDQARNET